MNGRSQAWSFLMALAALIVFGGAFFVAGHYPAPPLPSAAPLQAERPVGTSGAHPQPPPPRSDSRGESGAAEVGELRARNLLLPIEGTDAERWNGSFAETHNGHLHEAVDILAPRNTPIRAVDDGRVAKLFESKAGGLTVYEVDPSQRFIYYYAHLERYAHVHDGDAVTRGEVIGYVGTSGNAPPDTPHLHFAIFRVADPRRWWEGTAIDPYLVFTTTTGPH